MGAYVHPFDVPLDEPIEGLGPSAVAVHDHGPADAEVGEDQPDDDQQQGPGDQLDAAEGAADQVDDDHQPGDDVEHDRDHGAIVPTKLTPIQLRRALTAWFDTLTTFDQQAVGLHQVQEAELALGDVEAELVEQLAAAIEGPWVETPAGILQTASRGGHVSWDAEAIWPDALAEARRRAADPETGELSEEADRGCRAMLDVVREILSGPAFRVKQLKAIGVDPDEVRATAPKRKIVRFA